MGHRVLEVGKIVGNVFISVNSNSQLVFVCCIIMAPDSTQYNSKDKWGQIA